MASSYVENVLQPPTMKDFLLTLLFYDYRIPVPRNCLVNCDLLTEAPQASCLVVGLYHVISGTAR